MRLEMFNKVMTMQASRRALLQGVRERRRRRRPRLARFRRTG